MTSRTIQSYEDYAVEYNRSVSSTPSPETESALRRLVALVRPGGTVLEVGSGPGRDADFVESLGVQVRRTDATRAFLELQAARGKHGELLNVITDELGGPYDAVLAMCVLIHVGRDMIDDVLAKIAAALHPGGGLLVCLREGAGETVGKFHTTYWGPEFADHLAAAGLPVVWSDRDVDEDGDVFLTFLARKAP